jgi:RNA polymerase sigma-70 factor, ECF subfamily
MLSNEGYWRPFALGVASERAASCSGDPDPASRRRQLEELFRVHQDFLRRLATQMCRSMFDPDDLLQDVLERTVLHYHPARSNHRAWMARVMRNLFVDRIRRRASSPPPALFEDDVPEPAVDLPAWWEGLDVDAIRARLDELPDEQRTPLELFTFERCSYREIASRLGIPSNTVATRILRARRQLRRLLLKRGASQAT